MVKWLNGGMVKSQNSEMVKRVIRVKIISYINFIFMKLYIKRTVYTDVLRDQS